MVIGAFIFWIGLAIAVALYAQRKGRSAVGWLLFSIILSPLLGLIFVAVLPELVDDAEADRVPCPFSEDIRPKAIKCPQCRTELGARWIPGARAAD